MPVSLSLGTPGLVDLRKALRDAGAGAKLLPFRVVDEVTRRVVRPLVESDMRQHQDTGRAVASLVTKVMSEGSDAAPRVLGMVLSDAPGVPAQAGGVPAGKGMTGRDLLAWVLRHWGGGLSLFLTSRGKARSATGRQFDKKGRYIPGSAQERTAQEQTGRAAEHELQRRAFPLSRWLKAHGIKATHAWDRAAAAGQAALPDIADREAELLTRNWAAGGKR